MKTDIKNISRRAFAKQLGAYVGGGLVLAYGGPLLGKRVLSAFAADKHFKDGKFKPSVFVSIGDDGKVRLVCHRSEMGQGARTAMLMLIAEELRVDLSDVMIVQADGDKVYGDQNTDGSHSVRANWDRLREFGAAAREMLVEAAAKKWGVPLETCVARNGKVSHSSGKALAYGELAPLAAKLPVPVKPKLRKKSEFEVIGKPKVHLDIDSMLAGSARFGIDTAVRGLVYASLERSPTVGGSIASLDDSEARKIPGVIKVVRVPRITNMTNEAVAVVAENTWAAARARAALKIEWKNPAPVAEPLSFNGEKKVFLVDGDFKAAKSAAARVIEATYRTPYLVHATMEPPACTAHVSESRCEVWAPSQDPQGARKAVASYLGMHTEDVTIHVTLLGGGFGRKSQPDFVLEAVAVSKLVGKPVKVTWTREDEIKHGFYHAHCMQHLEATLDEKGQVTGWHHQTAFPTIGRLFNPSANVPADFEVGMGVTNLPYRIPNQLCEAYAVKTDVRVAWYRSVCNVFHAFGVNSFIDELAHETGRDPVKLRLELLEGKGETKVNSERMARVIKLAAEISGWDKRARSKGGGMGFACHFSFESYVAVVIEVDARKNGIKPVKAFCVIDCGSFVNPDTVKAQMEGSIVFGISAALSSAITIKDGKVEQSNFYDYEVARMSKAPETHVHIVESAAPPAGVGEPGVPPVAPALCAAIFEATGKRVRELPYKS